MHSSQMGNLRLDAVLHASADECRIFISISISQMADDHDRDLDGKLETKETKKSRNGK